MTRIYRIDYRGTTEHAVERDGALFTLEGELFGAHASGPEIRGGLGAAGLRVLPPVTPSKIVCIGRNYRDHAAELGNPVPPEPLIFLKPPTTVIATGEPVLLPPGVGRVDYEAELAVVIGRRAHRVPRARAWDYILGITCMNDVTARDVQKRESHLTRAKSFDRFGPLGPCILTGVTDAPRTVEGWVNGERRQQSSTEHLIFPIDHLVEFITFVMTLEPGDVISTGTPAGVGPVKAGDVVTVKVEGVGELVNAFRDE
jgi:2-keto-4-pentenoate hydratase/2-oxohepta-3-ene-1,7-dioic acid hydratase in catechol pathway